MEESVKSPRQQTRNVRGHAKRHCWECRRRCLVCDSGVPGCERCYLSGIQCPGYGDVKPTRLKWIMPGRVVSRDQKQKKNLIKDKQSNQVGVKARSTSEAVPVQVDIHMPISHFELNEEGYLVVQAFEYFNSCIYKDLVPIHDLGQNPYIYSLSSKHLQAAVLCPDHLKYGMLCMILGHRINQTRGRIPSKALVEKFYLYWGLAVRSLNEHLNMANKRAGDTVIAGILTLLLADIQQGTSLNWRCHLEAIYKLIMLRGGFHSVAESKSMEPLLLCFWFVAVAGNTTCPASDLFMTTLQHEAVKFLPQQYDTSVSPIQLCPIPLFIEIIKINHLRMKATRPSDAIFAQDLQKEGCEILSRIDCFSSHQLAESKRSCQEDWILVGQVYQAAVALYCILSLQSLSIFPKTQTLRARCAAYGRIIQLLLREALTSKKLKRFMIWPLVVLGVEAVHGSAATRAFVSKQLSELSQEVGTYVPLTAKQVLENFWASGDTRWDACFDRPYVFTGQIAVDTSGLMPSYK
ncbi:fungal-specific transcription factor domain-containing protein [Trichoderma chlorosporum]